MCATLAHPQTVLDNCPRPINHTKLARVQTEEQLVQNKESHYLERVIMNTVQGFMVQITNHFPHPQVLQNLFGSLL